MFFQWQHCGQGDNMINVVLLIIWEWLMYHELILLWHCYVILRDVWRDSLVQPTKLGTMRNPGDNYSFLSYVLERQLHIVGNACVSESDRLRLEFQHIIYYCITIKIIKYGNLSSFHKTKVIKSTYHLGISWALNETIYENERVHER